MFQSLFKSFRLLSLFLFLSSTVFAQYPANLPGSWEGELNTMGQKLRIWFHFVALSDSDSLKITMESPDQGASDIPVTDYQIEGKELWLEVASISGIFEGKFNDSFDLVEGKWKQGFMSFKLDLHKSLTSLSISRPQEPQPPFPYEELFLKIPHQEAGIELGATLTRVSDHQNAPTVILVSGSGPQNRNSEILGHKPFWVMADFFSRNGVNVLRYDDRGVAESSGKFSTATTFDLASDVSAIVDFLKNRKDIDAGKIGIIGHSEGGMIAPMVASQRNDLAFIVMLAGPGSSGEEILYQQSAKIAALEGAEMKEIDRTIEDLKVLYEVAGSDLTYEEGAEELRKFYKKKRRFLLPRQVEKRGLSKQQTEMIIQQVMSEWFRTFLKINPSEYLPFVKVPVFAAFGDMDSQVLIDPNRDLVANYLKEGGNKQVVVQTYPGLNHLFQHATTGSPTEYALIEETFADEVLYDMLRFIQKSTGLR